MAWMYVFLAAIVEVFWVIGLKYSDSLLDWTGTIIAIVLSFLFIIRAFEQLPSGTVYAVFTGLGAAAIILIDSVYFGASFSTPKFLFICLIVTGVVGLKISTSETGGERRGMDLPDDSELW